MRDHQIGDLSVSRETFERLRLYEDLVIKWSKAINLVSSSTLGQIWDRHILDSCQLFPLGLGNTWLDLGSGGGFPGCVIAILSAELQPDRAVTLVESDQRKATFLRQVLRETGVEGAVLSSRIEDIEPVGATTVSARALSELSHLIEHLCRHGAPTARGIFPKGKNWRIEVEKAEQSWQFEYNATTSITNPEAVILDISGVKRV